MEIIKKRCSKCKIEKPLEEFYPNSETGEMMTWDNYGIPDPNNYLSGWHMDHIKPLDSFELSDRQQFLIAANYTNIQPLWAYDNLSKGSERNNV